MTLLCNVSALGFLGSLFGLNWNRFGVIYAQRIFEKRISRDEVKVWLDFVLSWLHTKGTKQ
jgi:hypothetical protein